MRDFIKVHGSVHTLDPYKSFVPLRLRPESNRRRDEELATFRIGTVSSGGILQVKWLSPIDFTGSMRASYCDLGFLDHLSS